MRVEGFQFERFRKSGGKTILFKFFLNRYVYMTENNWKLDHTYSFQKPYPPFLPFHSSQDPEENNISRLKHDRGPAVSVVPGLHAGQLRAVSPHPQLPADDLSSQAEHHQQTQLLLCLLYQL